jgi:hypothetical protein
MKSWLGEVTKYCPRKRRAPTLPSVALRGATAGDSMSKHITDCRQGQLTTIKFVSQQIIDIEHTGHFDQVPATNVRILALQENGVTLRIPIQSSNRATEGQNG